MAVRIPNPETGKRRAKKAKLGIEYSREKKYTKPLSQLRRRRNSKMIMIAIISAIPSDESTITACC